MKPSEILLAARERIAAPGGWSKRCRARDDEGRDVHPTSPKAVSFCMLGAIQVTIGVPVIESPDEETAEEFVKRAAGTSRAWIFNDEPNRTQLECVVALEKAALLAMSEGQ